ncbi:MAG: glucokinase [Candidatus Moduliflexus flocculans]|nr:glucokinase [Candidatus Moduliflexus flocculans]
MHASTNAPAATVPAVDVGGTNTSCAIVRSARGRFDKLFERRYSTRAEPSLTAPLGRFVDEAAAPERRAPSCSASAARAPSSAGRSG